VEEKAEEEEGGGGGGGEGGGGGGGGGSLRGKINRGTRGLNECRCGVLCCVGRRGLDGGGRRRERGGARDGLVSVLVMN